MKNLFGCAVALLAVLPARAHRLDECLQGTFVSLGTRRISIELNVTPGVAIADRLLGIVDTDRDGLVSKAESAAFAARIAGSLSLAVDGEPRSLRCVGSFVPVATELRTGTAAIQLEFETESMDWAPGKHRVDFRNRWEPMASVYLANALVPASRSIRVLRQQRDERQMELRLELDADGEPGVAGTGSRGARLGWGLAGIAAMGIGLGWVTRRRAETTKRS